MKYCSLQTECALIRDVQILNFIEIQCTMTDNGKSPEYTQWFLNNKIVLWEIQFNDENSLFLI